MKKRVRHEARKKHEEVSVLRAWNSGSRRGRLPAVRTRIVRGLVENYGVGVAEVARRVGIPTSGGFEDPNENVVQLINNIPSTVLSVISHHIRGAWSPSFSTIVPLPTRSLPVARSDSVTENHCQ